MTLATSELYDRAAPAWRRREPVLLSDFTARPFLLSWCQEVARERVLDLGCGEGYVARALARGGARHVLGIDVSAEMIAAAQAQELAEPLGIEFCCADATQGLSELPAAGFELAVAVFLFNYLTRDRMLDVLRETHRLLAPGGTLIFAVPHPSLPFLRPEEPPFFFQRAGHGYFSGRDALLEGRIWRRDGESVPVRCVHKSAADYFQALAAAGFDRLPEVAELGVRPEDLARDPGFFGPLADQPLHMALRITR